MSFSELWHPTAPSLRASRCAAYMQADWGYVVIWEFRVQPGMEADFERAYGSEGRWAQLFRTGDGFSGTELHRDVSVPGRYVTLDFWSSGEAYQRFRQRNAAR